MSVKFPYGAANELIVLAEGGTITKAITNNNTLIETETLTDNVILNLEVDENVQSGALLTIKCTTDATETFEFGGQINAPTITGVTGKTWSQSFIYNGVNFYPSSVHSFSESLCPTITIGDNLDSGITVTGSGDETLAALITGGAGPYTIGTVTGTIPTGQTLEAGEVTGDYYVILTGIPTTFGSYSFTVTVLDANGCESSAKSFTIEVYYSYTNSTPVVINGMGTMNVDLTSSGIAGLFGVDADVVSLEVNVSSTVGNLDNSAADFYGAVQLFLLGDISGTALTNTVFSINGVGNISAGTPPYSSSYLQDFSGLDNETVSQNYQFIINDDLSILQGSIDSITIIIKPI